MRATSSQSEHFSSSSLLSCIQACLRLRLFDRIPRARPKQSSCIKRKSRFLARRKNQRPSIVHLLTSKQIHASTHSYGRWGRTCNTACCGRSPKPSSNEACTALSPLHMPRCSSLGACAGQLAHDVLIHPRRHCERCTEAQRQDEPGDVGGGEDEAEHSRLVHVVAEVGPAARSLVEDTDLGGEGDRPEDELCDDVGQRASSAILLHVVHGDVAVGVRLPHVKGLLCLCLTGGFCLLCSAARYTSAERGQGCSSCPCAEGGCSCGAAMALRRGWDGRGARSDGRRVVRRWRSDSCAVRGRPSSNESRRPSRERRSCSKTSDPHTTTQRGIPVATERHAEEGRARVGGTGWRSVLGLLG
mmetsp:Transcript_153076/g.388935  ORF Transcript_153076/g.388935 Transcript_153076/m.388935 type:complete len:358 (-) Transcript_153076:8-1081(-)